eukprot:1374163-Pleurochrysis_carterae.AAC.2
MCEDTELEKKKVECDAGSGQMRSAHVENAPQLGSGIREEGAQHRSSPPDAPRHATPCHLSLGTIGPALPHRPPLLSPRGETTAVRRFQLHTPPDH